MAEWRQEEVENINKTLEGADRKAALCQLLEQETELIASIGRHKIDSDAENRVLRIQNFLSKVHGNCFFKEMQNQILGSFAKFQKSKKNLIELKLPMIYSPIQTFF